jgi:hypothetical protein
MAFPATYDFNYYKGDTFEFRIYPKKNDGTVFDLSPFYDSNVLYSTNSIDGVGVGVAPYEQARFSIATSRGSAESATIKCFARVDSDTNTFIQCAIRPTEGNQLVAGTEYVYDVEVRHPAGGPDSPFYEKVITLMTGKITVTDQVTRDPVPGD